MQPLGSNKEMWIFFEFWKRTEQNLHQCHQIWSDLMLQISNSFVAQALEVYIDETHVPASLELTVK